MLDEYNTRSPEHLINLIRQRSNGVPNFAILIGAGASVSSGIKSSRSMIKEWREQLYLESNSELSFQEWLENQNWYNIEKEYSILFEKLYDGPGQRRIYIETCIEGANPSWGYIYLSNIIANNYFNVVFTPNFDDLLNEACFRYAQCKPVVCAHDSEVLSVRVTQARPKIIKLHGDFLYENIKNTVKETENLEKNMRDKFIQFCREYGLITIGYSCNDDSIIDNINMMLKTEGYLPNGLYCCIRKNNIPSNNLKRLLEKEGSYLVEIDGFDEFMADLHEGLGLSLPDIVRDPYKAITESLNRFIVPSEKIHEHPIIKKDIFDLENKIKNFEQIISTKSIEEFDELIPYSFLGDREYADNNYQNALLYYEKTLNKKEVNVNTLDRMWFSYISLENFEKSMEISEELIIRYPDNFIGYYRKSRSLKHQHHFEQSLEFSEKGLKLAKTKSERVTVFINRADTYLHLNDWDNAIFQADQALAISISSDVAILNKSVALMKLSKIDDAILLLNTHLENVETNYIKACYYAILNDKENMIKFLNIVVEDMYYKVMAKFDVEFDGYKDDPDFIKLTTE